MKIKPFVASALISIALFLFLRFGISAYARLFVLRFDTIEAAWIVGAAMWVIVKSIQISPLLYRLEIVTGVRYWWLAIAALFVTPIDIIATFKAFYWFSDELELANIILSIGCAGWAGLVRLMVLQWLSDRPLVIPPFIQIVQPVNNSVAHSQDTARTVFQPQNSGFVAHSRSTPSDSQFDLIAAMSNSPENTLILAPSESGKGIVIGNLIAAFKTSTDCSVTAIDPKGAITEDGFFAQCDRVHRFKSQELDRDQIIAETKKGWKMFTEECRQWEGVKPCFILIDEMLVIGGCFSKAKDSFLQDKIASLVSMGRSQRQFCWIATQYPQLDKIGVDGGIAGQMEMLIIARRKNVTLIKPWGTKYDLTRGVDFRDIESACDNSPVDRAVYWRGEWKPMSRMENKSGFDRETNKWVSPPPMNNQQGTAAADSTAAATLDSLVLEYFAAASDRPRTLKNLRDSSRLRDRASSSELEQSLDRLTNCGKLERHSDGWVCVGWIEN